VTLQPVPESGATQQQVPHVAGPPSGFVCPPIDGCTVPYAPEHPASTPWLFTRSWTNPFHPVGIASTQVSPVEHVGPTGWGAT
jgi:hypothetical protein